MVGEAWETPLSSNGRLLTDVMMMMMMIISMQKQIPLCVRNTIKKSYLQQKVNRKKQDVTSNCPERHRKRSRDGRAAGTGNRDNTSNRALGREDIPNSGDGVTRENTGVALTEGLTSWAHETGC